MSAARAYPLNRLAEVPAELSALDESLVLERADGGELLPALTARESAARRAVQLHTLEELASRPAPQHLVEGVLVESSLAAIIGMYASFKSFVALSLALCIAVGLDWYGRRVRQGLVVYILGEGAYGIVKRVEAWRLFNRLPDVGGIHFITHAAKLNDPTICAAVIANIAELPTPPVAIFVDTLARTLRGNESDSEDMGAYVEACDQIRESTGAAVILVHHMGWQGERSRGSSVLPGAIDTELTLKRDDDQVTVTTTKMKDGPEGLVVTLEAVTIGGSLALSPVVPTSSKLTRNEELALTQVQNPEGLTSTEWKDVCGLAKGSYDNARRRLLTLGYVKHAKNRYVATDAGRLALGTTDNRGTSQVQHTTTHEVQNTHTPKGVSVVLGAVPEADSDLLGAA